MPAFTAMRTTAPVATRATRAGRTSAVRTSALLNKAKTVSGKKTASSSKTEDVIECEWNTALVTLWMLPLRGAGRLAGVAAAQCCDALCAPDGSALLLQGAPKAALGRARPAPCRRRIRQPLRRESARCIVHSPVSTSPFSPDPDVQSNSLPACLPSDVSNLPGASAPFNSPFFDPAGFAKTANISDIRRWRESELVHGACGWLIEPLAQPGG